MIIFNVTKDKVSIKQDDTLNRGEYNVTKCKFLFSKEYDGLVKEAIFFIEEKNIGILLDENDECNIPQEAFKFRGNVEIGLYAYYTNNNKLEKRYSPSRTTKVISDGSYTSEIDNTEEITPTDKEQMNSIIKNNVEEIKRLSTNKVDKVDGYNLSENNFSNIYKKKLDGIEQNAQVNKIEKIFINDDEMPIVDKKINITIPTKLTDLKNDNYFVNDINYVHTDNNFSHAEKEKLKELNNYDDSSLNEKIVENSNSILENKKDIQNLKETSEKNTSNINEFNKNLQNCSLITETGYKLDLSIDNSTYVMTLKLLDKNENVLSTGKIDLPIESMINNVSYDSNVKRLTFSLQNGNIINVPLNDLISGLVTEENLEETLKEYALKKDIPKNLSELKNDSNYVKNTDYATTTGAGVIKGTGAFSFIVDSEGQPKSNILNYDQYNKNSLNNFISKGTLENVITGKNLETANNKVPSVGTSSTDTEYPSAKCVYKIKEDVDNLKSDILETGETSDTFVHLEDSAMAEYQELSVDGVCEQVTTTGKNLFDKNSNIINGYHLNVDTGEIESYPADFYQEDYIIAKPNTMYSISSSANTWLRHCEYDENKNFITGSTRTCFTTNENTKFIRVSTGKDRLNLLQLEESATITEYEPYTGGQPSPSPDYPQEIKTIENSLKITSCNKNLFDWYNANWLNRSLMTDGITKNSDGTITFTASGSGYAMAETKITLLKGTYCFNSSHENNTVLLYGSNELNKNGFTLDEKKQITIRVYIPKAIKGSNVTISSMQITKGTQQSQYIQHLETQITANLPEGEFIGKINDTYKDRLKVEYNETDGQYHLNLYKNIGRVVLDGSEDWIGGLSAVNSPDYTYFYVDGTYPFIKSHVYECYCNKFTNLGKDMTINTVVNTDTISVGNAPYNKIRIMIKISRLSSQDIKSFKDLLKNEQPKLYYQLATPYKIDLGVVDMPITYNEITNLFTDSDLMPTINAKYYKNFISTIRNLQVNNANLKNELMSINNRLVALESANASTISDEEESEVVNNE